MLRSIVSANLLIFLGKEALQTEKGGEDNADIGQLDYF
jgi:hypothetical protein